MIYLDNAATTKPLFNAIKECEKYLNDIDVMRYLGGRK